MIRQCEAPGCDEEAVTSVDSAEKGGTMSLCGECATAFPICQNFHSVSDASFGYWNAAWGDEPIHEFACSNPATVTRIDPYDGEVYRLCAECAKQ